MFDFAFISITKINNQNVSINKKLDSSVDINENFSFELILTKGIISSCKINVEEQVSFEFTLVLHYLIKNKNTSLVIKSSIEESE